MIRSRLRYMVALHDTTLKEVAAKTGIRPETLSHINNSKAKHLPVYVMDRLCELFDCQPGDLLEYIPNEKPSF